MRVLYFGCLLFVIGRILAEDEIDEGEFADDESVDISDKFGAPSEKCLEEMYKYNSCTSKLNMFSDEDMDLNTSMTMNSKEAIQEYCTTMETDDCKSFIADVEKEKSVCLSEGIEFENYSNLLNALVIINLRVQYLMYCSKGNDGNLCPLGAYLQDHPNEMNNDSEPSKLTSEQLQIIANDCKDSICNARMLSLSKIIEVLDSDETNEGGDTSTMSNSPYLYHTYIKYYRENKCDAIMNSSPTTIPSNAIPPTTTIPQTVMPPHSDPPTPYSKPTNPTIPSTTIPPTVIPPHFDPPTPNTNIPTTTITPTTTIPSTAIPSYSNPPTAVLSNTIPSTTIPQTALPPHHDPPTPYSNPSTTSKTSTISKTSTTSKILNSSNTPQTPVEDSGAIFTFRKITYSFIFMGLLSSILLF